jgi:hypothetical protein
MPRSHDIRMMKGSSMNTERIVSVAHQCIDGFGSTAHVAIDAWRDGGERLGQAAKSRWDAALKQSAPKLSPETRRNAAHAQKVLGGYYSRGVRLSAGGAEVAVDTLVQAARVAVDRAAAWQQARA